MRTRVAKEIVCGSRRGGDCRALVMDERDSVDVDTPAGLELAEALLY